MKTIIENQYTKKVKLQPYTSNIRKNNFQELITNETVENNHDKGRQCNIDK